MHVQEVAQEVAALQEHASHRKKQKCRIFVVLTHKNIETQEVKNVHCKFVDILHLFITTSFVALNLSS